jgi:hypothetical protein
MHLGLVVQTSVDCRPGHLPFVFVLVGHLAAACVATRPAEGHCATVAPRPVQAYAEISGARPRRILLVSSAAWCDQTGDDKILRQNIVAESDDLSKRLRRLASDAEVLVYPSAPDRACPLLSSASGLQALVERDSRPLWLLYAGHATIVRDKSALCLDRLVPVDELLGWIHPSVPYSTILLNACRTANVEIVGNNTVVISASSGNIETQSGGTVLYQRLSGALSKLENATNRDRPFVFTSDTLFDSINGIYINRHPLMPKLMSQAWTPLPLFTFQSGTAKQSAEAAEVLLSHLATAAKGEPPEDAISDDNSPALRFRRPVSHAERTLLHKEGWRACPCMADDGQCFCREQSIGRHVR